jgi:hypothetical protein
MDIPIYIVTHYGCNSSHNDMWIPRGKAFTDFAKAYEYFLSIAPSIDDEDEYPLARRYVNGSYDPNSTNSEYIVIEDRCQDGDCVKRPFGALIARCGIQ